MKRRHHTPEQIIRKLRETDRLLGEGKLLVEVRKHVAVTKPTQLPGRVGFAAHHAYI